MDVSTTAPFSEALRDLIAKHGLSFRRFAALTPAIDGRGLGHAYIQQLASGAKQPTRENMELLARGLGVMPEHFREYRVFLVEDEARRLAGVYGADVVLGKLAELD